MAETDLIAQRTAAAEARDAADLAHATACTTLAESAAFKKVLAEAEALYDPDSPDVGLDDAVRSLIQVMRDLPAKAGMVATDIQRRRGAWKDLSGQPFDPAG